MTIYFETSETEKKVFNKINFLKLNPGQHIIRILNIMSVYTHFIPQAKVSIKCLLEDCPICGMNKKIMTEHPDDFRKITGFLPRSKRHYFNCLDRTDVKVCPTCQAEVKRGGDNKFPPICPEGHVILEAEVTKSGKVKVGSVSDTNGNLMNTYAKSSLDAEGNSASLSDFDFLLMVTKMPDGKNNTAPMPIYANNDALEIPDDALYNLEDAVVNLNPNEIVNLLKGVSLRDLYLARKGSTSEVLEEKVTELSADIKSDLEKILS